MGYRSEISFITLLAQSPMEISYTSIPSMKIEIHAKIKEYSCNNIFDVGNEELFFILALSKEEKA